MDLSSLLPIIVWTYLVYTAIYAYRYLSNEWRCGWTLPSRIICSLHTHAHKHTHTRICPPLTRKHNGGPHCLPSCQSVCNVQLLDVGEISCLTISPRLVKVREFGLYRPVMFGIFCLKALPVFVFVSIYTDRNGSCVIKGINIFGMYALIL